MILRQLHQGQKAAQVAVNMGMAPKTIRVIVRPYEAEGLEAALDENPRLGRQWGLDVNQSQRIIAMVCGAPQVGRETIRILLPSHELKPWREKSWCISQLNEGVHRRLEDLLTLYEKLLSEREPVVCVGEDRWCCTSPKRLRQYDDLRREDSAWNRRINRDQILTDWWFTRTKARSKFDYKRNYIMRSTKCGR